MSHSPHKTRTEGSWAVLWRVSAFMAVTSGEEGQQRTVLLGTRGPGLTSSQEICHRCDLPPPRL